MKNLAKVDMRVTIKLDASGAKFVLRVLVFPIKAYAWCSAVWAKFCGRVPTQIIITIKTNESLKKCV